MYISLHANIVKAYIGVLTELRFYGPFNPQGHVDRGQFT